jgi:alginate O-acetyltransferase complex protein AlgI
MLFNSLEFVLFFIVVTSIFFFLPHKFRWFHLLLASCYFYMAFVPVYIVILAGTIVTDYFAGILIENAAPSKRKLFLLISLVANIGVLAVFKYYNFFIENINLVAGSFQLPYLKMLLPIGLSFHTFQAMSYTIEVYRGNQKAERHFGIYALYVMFYPQLVAGPIERPQNILHQFYEKKQFNQNDFFIGFKMMLWGMFKKVVIADRLAIFVNQLYDNPGNFSGSMHFVGAVFFAVQIYCDFSGYSSIAIGAARTMGFKLMTNFKNPYQSVTVSEFWTRWHISLSSWFKDYLFYPIAVAKRNWGIWAVVLATLITFIVSGLWHGAGWNFIFWGFLTGLFIVFETLLNVKSVKIRKDPIKKVIGIVYVFLVFAFTEIFFRAKNISEGFYVVKKIFLGRWSIPEGTVIFTNFSLILSVALIVFLFYAEATFAEKIIESKLEEKKKGNFIFGVAVLSMILLLGVFQKLSFIYFQF